MKKATLLLCLLLFSGCKKEVTTTQPPATKGAMSIHQAVLNYSNSTCTTSKPCSIQVYRAGCAATCPGYTPGSSAYVLLPAASTTVTVNVTASNTTWQVIDNDPALADSTLYGYVATNTYQSAPNVFSAGSSLWSGTTIGPSPTAPPAPQNGTGNTITQNKPQPQAKPQRPPNPPQSGSGNTIHFVQRNDA